MSHQTEKGETYLYVSPGETHDIIILKLANQFTQPVCMVVMQVSMVAMHALSIAFHDFQIFTTITIQVNRDNFRLE